MEQAGYKNLFVPDCGTLLDIMVFNTDLADWRTLLAFLSAHYDCKYFEDQKLEQLPATETIFQNRPERWTMLQIAVGGISANAHFFSVDGIEIDIPPNDVDSADKADAVFALMRGVSATLGKRVFLTAENHAVSDNERRAMAVCYADPTYGKAVIVQGGH